MHRSFPSRWSCHPLGTELPAREAIVQEYLNCRLGKKLRVSAPNDHYAYCLHTSVPTDPSSSNTSNRFAVLQNEVPAPRPDELRQQLQRLQAQMSGLERQLQGQNIPETSRSEGRHRPYVANHRPQHDRQTWAPRQRGPFVPTYQRRQAPQPAHWNHWPRRQVYP